MKTYTPYTYLVGWSQLGLYYYGVRHAKKDKVLYKTGCHPDDFFVTYFTSSVYVQELIDKNGNPDVIQVRKTFTSVDDAVAWETRVLKRLNLKTSSKWLNKNVAGKIDMTPDISKKISQKMLSLNIKRNEEFKKIVSITHKNKKIPDETKKYLSEINSGVNHPQFGTSRSVQTKLKIGEKNRGNNQQLLSCCVCGKQGKGSVMYRHHFDKCKQNTH